MSAPTFTPAYLEILDGGELRRRAARLRDRLTACDLCPRRCGADRRDSKQAICGIGMQALVSSAAPHFGEEPPITGRKGSGTIFFAGCNLRCWFCQNAAISHGRAGRAVTESELASLMLMLQEAGCHNINLVTPSHVVPQIVGALALAVERGLAIPLVYNSGGYDAVDVLEVLDGIVDIYMPDLKYADRLAARRLSGAPDYPPVARAALREMHRQVGDLVVGADGVACRGMLVRHLVLPGGAAGTGACMRFIAEELSRDTCVNVMDQYRPVFQAHRRPEIARPLRGEEHEAALRTARRCGLWRFAR